MLRNIDHEQNFACYNNVNNFFYSSTLEIVAIYVKFYVLYTVCTLVKIMCVTGSAYMENAFGCVLCIVEMNFFKEEAGD